MPPYLAGKKRIPKRESRPQSFSATHLLLLQIKEANLPLPILEHRFSPPRRFRFDFAWVDLKIALEIEGGIWVGGRHTRPAGYLNDMKKYNLGTSNGWQIYRHAPEWIRQGQTIEELKSILPVL